MATGAEARQPGLPFARHARRTVIVAKFSEPCGRHILAPSVKIMIRAVALGPSLPRYGHADLS